jgi:hypothetical protein
LGAGVVGCGGGGGSGGCHHCEGGRAGGLCGALGAPATLKSNTDFLFLPLVRYAGTCGRAG